MQSRRATWQQHPATQLAAVALGLGPLYTLVILSGAESVRAGGLPELDISSTLINLLVLVGGCGIWLLVLLWLLCGERLSDLDVRTGTWLTDLLSGLMIACLLVASQLILSLAANAWWGVELPEANAQIAEQLSSDPLLLGIWLGPVVWLQAGFFEELTRVFMLSRLWKVWTSTTGKLMCLIASAVLFGLGHIYQGPYGILGTGFIGLILGWMYLTRGRVLPLIIGHAVYDTMVLVTLVSAVRNGLI